MALHTFAGGIHPPENKHVTADKPFANLSIPQQCYIPMLQHIGRPAKPVVQVGDTVAEGQLIGEADGLISANIFASIPGRVVEIAEYHTVHAKKGICVVIEAHGSFEPWNAHGANGAWKDMDSGALLDRVRNAGIVCLGGAAFPTHVKLNPPKNRAIDALIVNGSECEPYLTVDDMLIRTFPEEILEGTRITMKILGIGRAFIGIENNKKNAIEMLRSAIRGSSFEETIELRPLKTKYPQGAEKQLIKSILNREVPSGGLPMDAGTVVQNVGTIFAVREAVVQHKPLFERYMTVTGPCVRNPGNYKVRLGTRISEIIEECGGLMEEPARIIMGGPMCGIALDSMDIPVIKGTSGILLLKKDQIIRESYRPCIRCGRCVEACPSGLVPCDLVNSIEKGRYDLVEPSHPFDCIMCGSCAYVCPSRRPLNHFIKVAQEKLRQKHKE